MARESHLTRAIAESGMTSTGKRANDTKGGKHTIVIVRGAWTLETVKEASNDVLKDAAKLDAL